MCLPYDSLTGYYANRLNILPFSETEGEIGTAKQVKAPQIIHY